MRCKIVDTRDEEYCSYCYILCPVNNQAHTARGNVPKPVRFSFSVIDTDDNPNIVHHGEEGMKDTASSLVHAVGEVVPELSMSTIALTLEGIEISTMLKAFLEEQAVPQAAGKTTLQQDITRMSQPSERQPPWAA